MSNLLEKASIVLTPTAYNNGKVLCVKPSDGSGDFDFSRNSAATRVNAQGLVEDVQILSSNLVQNGNFSEQGSQLITNGNFATDSNWNLISGVTYNAGGYLDFDGSQGNGSVTNTPNTTFTLNKTYKVVYEIKNYTSGTIKFRFQGGSNTIGQQQSGDGVKTEYIVCNDSSNNNFNFFGSSSFIGSIDNVSVKEVGQNWSLTGTAEISNGAASFPNNSASYLIQSSIIDLSVKQYKLQYEIVSTNGFNCRIAGGNSAFGTFNLDSLTVGVKTAYLTSNGTKGNLQINNNAFIGSVTNISIIEITDDTNLPRINYEGFSYQDALGSEQVINGDFSNGATGWVVGTGWSIGGGTADFDIAVATGNTSINTLASLKGEASYRVSFTINNTSGSGKLLFQGSGGGTDTFTSYVLYESGEHTLDVTPTANRTTFKILGQDGSGNFSIDNISIKEVLGQEVVPDSGCGNWLWEPQSTNLIPYSEDFTQWDKINSNVISINETNPINSVAYEIESTVSSNKSRIYYNSLMVSGSSYSTSYLVKPSSNSPQYLGFACISNTTPDVFYNFSNNQFEDNTIVGNAAKCESIQMLNGWRLLKVPIHNNVTNTRLNIYQGGISGGELIGVNGQSYYLKFAQLEEQSYVTSYIPTDGTTVTRNQDVCDNGGSLASINSPEGVLYAQIARDSNDGNVGGIQISDGTTNNNLRLFFNQTDTISVITRVGGSNNIVKTAQAITSSTAMNKFALVWKLNDYKLYYNGAVLWSDTSASVYPIGTLNVIDFKNQSNPFFGKTKCLAVFPFLTDTELAELTTI